MGMTADLAEAEVRKPHPAWLHWNKQLDLCVKAKREGGEHRREDDYWFTVVTPDRQKVFEFQHAKMEHLLYDVTNGIWYTAGGVDARDQEFRDLFLGRLVKWCQEAKQGEAFYYRSNSLILERAMHLRSLNAFLESEITRLGEQFAKALLSKLWSQGLEEYAKRKGVGHAARR